MSSHGLDQSRRRMQAAGVDPTAIGVFERFYRMLEQGATGLIAERDIQPLTDVERRADLNVPADVVAAAFAGTALIKLNGGLGTSMGMDRAKSLLTVREDAGARAGGRAGEDGPLSFLDVIVGQVRAARARTGARLPLLFMNSFRTRQDTLAALARYPDLAVEGLPVDFLQHREPKLDTQTLEPVDWPADPALEWCPPGHGDLYPALYATGILAVLRAAGFRYASVTNADNLGAAPDPAMAGWFAASGAPYAAEVCRRTPADVKGGYLVVRKSDGRLVLRETAQTPPQDAAASDDITRHRYFHCNNLWFNLDALAAELERTDGVIELPLIRNAKTVDPTDSDSTPVIQIESAMGGAIEVFDGARAIEVDRSRFLPVKTTNDLLVLRSDVYRLDEDFRLVADVEAPLVDLDPRFYKTVADFDARIPAAPSLRDAESLTVRGDWTFGAGVAARGAAEVGPDGAPGRVADGTEIRGPARG